MWIEFQNLDCEAKVEKTSQSRRNQVTPAMQWGCWGPSNGTQKCFEVLSIN